MKSIVTISLFFYALLSFGGVQFDTLYINAGFVHFQSDSVYSYVFNDQNTFKQGDTYLTMNELDTLNLFIVNQNNVQHDLQINGTGISAIISPLGSTSMQIFGLGQGVYQLRDENNTNQYLGLSLMLRVGFADHPTFYWNLREHHSDWNDSLQLGFQPTSGFLPDYFSVNHWSFPDSQSDSTALAIGNVGDTLYACVLNSGKCAHALHTHGYHGEILFSSKYPSHVGRSKDVFPVLPNETLLIRFVPHQPGIYPVHDHNLTAVTSAGNYPGGMITRFNIQP